ANHIKGILLDGISIYEGKQYTYKTFEGNNFSCKNMVDLPIQLDTIRITVPFVRKRAWKHKKALFHMDKAISEMELEYLYTSHSYDAIIFAIHEMKMYRIQEYFEYKNVLSILKKYTVFIA
ncbi:hypothetical protein H5410_033067, partial [Solanum commersonii]